MFASLAPRGDEPVLRLEATAAFVDARIRVRDTARYRIRVEWREVPAAVMLLPPPRLEAHGFVAAGRNIVHRKLSGPDGNRNITEITYALVPLEPGSARIAPFALRYHNGLSGREETTNVPGAMLEVVSRSAPPLLRAAAWLLVLAVVAFVGFTLWKRRASRRGKGDAPGDAQGEPVADPGGPWARELAALRRRCDPERGGPADARVWIADAESLCTRVLCARMGVNDPSHVRFEAALERYLARNAARPAAEADAWATLRDLFHEARYAGTSPGTDALRSACRHLNTCLGAAPAPQGDLRT